jgi:ribosomal protein S18 acetylase RimI-like enzyme
MKAIIEDLTQSHTEELGKMHYKSWHHAYKHIMCSGFIDYKDEMKMIQDAKRKVGSTYIAKKDGIIIGFLYYRYHKNRIEIHELYIDPLYQNQHIASTLLKHLFQTHSHIEQLFLYVLEKNQKATLFYERFGFVKSNDIKTLVVDETHQYTEFKYTIKNPFKKSISI